MDSDADRSSRSAEKDNSVKPRREKSRARAIFGRKKSLGAGARPCP